MTEPAKPLIQVFDSINFNMLFEKILKARKVSRDDKVSYEGLTHVYNDMEYTIVPKDVLLDEIVSHANERCNTCFGKGYRVVRILKSVIKDPENFTVLADRSMKDITEEQKKDLIEEEKKKTTWKIILPCFCAIKKLQKEDPNVLANKMGNIVLRVEYSTKPIEAQHATAPA